MDFVACNVYDGVPGYLARRMVMDGVEVKGLESPGNSEVDNGNGHGNGDVRHEDGDDHEIEAAAGSLAAGVGEGVVGEGRRGGDGDLAVS